MTVEHTWLAVDAQDRVLVMWAGAHGAWPHATNLLEDDGAADQARIRALLRLDLPLDAQPARRLDHVPGAEPDVFAVGGGRGALAAADLPMPWRARARQYRLVVGEGPEVLLRDHLPLELLTAWGWGEADGMHPLDRARVDGIPTLPGWPAAKVEARLLALYAAVLFQAVACNAGGPAEPIALPGGPTPPIPVPSAAPERLDWTPILPDAGPLPRILWAHAHPAADFPRILRPSDLAPEALFRDGAFALRGGVDARQVLLLQKELRAALSDEAWRDYLAFLGSLLGAAPALDRVRRWVLGWERDHPWSPRSSMDDLFGGGGRVRMR